MLTFIKQSCNLYFMEKESDGYVSADDFFASLEENPRVYRVETPSDLLLDSEPETPAQNHQQHKSKDTPSAFEKGPGSVYHSNSGAKAIISLRRYNGSSED
jgi:hypothetical protein